MSSESPHPSEAPTRISKNRILKVALTISGIAACVLAGYFVLNTIFFWGLRCNRYIADEKLLRDKQEKSIDFSVRTTYFGCQAGGLGQDLILIRFKDGREITRKEIETIRVQVEDYTFQKESLFKFQFIPPNNLIFYDINSGVIKEEWYGLQLEYR